MTPYQEPAGAHFWVGNGLLLLALAVGGSLARAQLRLKADEQARWWASNGRDALNALALAALVGGLWGVGFAGPVALCLGALLLLAVSAALFALSARATPVAALGIALVLGGPVLLTPRSVDVGLRAAIGWVLG